jgi:hypothetical protein
MGVLMFLAEWIGSGLAVGVGCGIGLWLVNVSMDRWMR